MTASLQNTYEFFHTEANYGILVFVNIWVSIRLWKFSLEPVLKLFKGCTVAELSVNSVCSRNCTLRGWCFDLTERPTEQLMVLLCYLIGYFEWELGREQRGYSVEVRFCPQCLAICVIVVEGGFTFEDSNLLCKTVLDGFPHSNKVICFLVVEDGRSVSYVLFERIRGFYFGKLHSLYDYSKGKSKMWMCY